MTGYDAIVIGAGANGLTSAARIARNGRRVVVLEARDRAGGLAVAPDVGGMSIAGPLHDTSMVADVVIEGLNLAEHGLQRTPAPAMLGLEPDGPGVRIDGQSIAQRNETDGRTFARFNEQLERYGRILRRLLTTTPPKALSMEATSLMTLAGHGLSLRRLGREAMADLLRIVPMCSADWLNEWFEDELIKTTLAGTSLDGTFTGPWSPGSNACLLRHAALSSGQAAPGGPVAVIDALESAARASGVEIRFASVVDRIDVNDGAGTGVTLRDGERIESRCIISTCDPKRTFLSLVPREHLPRTFVRRIEQYRMDGCCALLLLALRSPLRFRGYEDEDVTLARTGTTLDELERAFDAVKYDRCSEVPLLRIAQHETGGGAAASVLVQFTPYHRAGGWTDEARASLEDAVMQELRRHVGALDELVLDHRMLSPFDIEEEFGATHGHIHHGEHGLDQMIVRPSPECAQYRTPIRGLVLGGSGAHPGGELTCLPGWLAAGSV